ncbi:MAG: SDR family NAD(P)-dependent oxidoreductase [Myxococcota bacterium]
MATFKESYGPWALVTGASAGIGRECARQIAAEGINLVLVARRKNLLEELGRELSAEHGVECVAAPVDLRAPGFLDPIRAATEGREIGLLVNNAGIGSFGDFLEADLEELQAILAVNTTAPTVLCHAYGREMAKRKRGGILMVSSMVAFMSAPRMWNYPASKAYDLLLGEALNYEFRDHGIAVSTLLPGFTAPGFTDNLDLSRVPMPIAKTPKVVRTALRTLGRRSLILPGLMNKMMYRMSSMMPRRVNVAMIGMMNKRIGWKDEAATSPTTSS